jgi:hypothetical protein
MLVRMVGAQMGHAEVTSLVRGLLSGNVSPAVEVGVQPVRGQLEGAGRGGAQLLHEVVGVPPAPPPEVPRQDCVFRAKSARDSDVKAGTLSGAKAATCRWSLKGWPASLDPAFARSLAARVRLALAEVAAALGDRAAAGEELRRARELYRLAPAAAEGVERCRREARAAAAGGDVAAVDALLEPVRRELLARGSLEEAARRTFEHLLLRIEERRLGEVGELTGQLAVAFPGEGERWAEEMAGLAQLVVTNPDGVHRACFGLRLRLRLRQATPCPSGQAGRPPWLTPVRLLADRLLRRRGELEDPIGAGMGL